MPQPFTIFVQRCSLGSRGVALPWAVRLMAVALLVTIMLPSGMIAQGPWVEHACAAHAADVTHDHADRERCGEPCADCPCASQPGDLPTPIRVLAVTNAISYLPRPMALNAPPAPIIETDLPPIIRG